MAIAYTFGSEAVTGSGMTVEITPPAHSDGDLLIVFGYRGNDGGTCTVNETGWTDYQEVQSTAGADSTIYVGYKVASSEPATLTWENTNSNSVLRAVCAKVTGFDSVSPIAGTAGTLGDVVNDSTPDPPAVTSITSGDKVFTLVAGQQAGTGGATQPSSYTLDFDNTANGRLSVASIDATGASENPGTWSGYGAGFDPGMITFAVALASTSVAAYMHHYRNHGKIF